MAVGHARCVPIDCVWLDENPYIDENRPRFTGQGLVGSTYYAKPDGYPRLSRHYREHVASTRPPILVIVPTRQGGQIAFCIDSHPTNDENGAWTVDVDMASLVAGQKPDITVAPSIDCVGLYHGFLQAGVLTDDLG